MKQSLHYTKILGVLSFLMLFALGNVWAKDFSSYDDLKNASTYNSTTKKYTYTGDVVIKGDFSIPETDQITINGNLTINSGKTLTINGSLIVTNNVVINGTVDMQGGILMIGSYKKDDNGKYILDESGNFQLVSNTGDLTLNSGSFLKYTSGDSYVVVRGNLTQNNTTFWEVITDGGHITVAKSPVSATLTVNGTYTDYTKSNYHPWGYDAGASSSNYLKFDSGINFTLAVSKYVYEGGTWTKLGVSTEAKKSWSSKGVNKDFVNTTQGTVLGLLPIELTSFTAEQNGDKITIAWTTNSEVNNDFFTIEYSIDGVTFKTLETVDGAGTTSEVQEYAISADASLFTGVVYFRLKQTDFNGNYSYSDVIALTVESEIEELIVYPNPATDYVTISGNIASAYVCDVYGKKIACSQNGNTFDVASLSVGTYYVVVKTESGKKVLPFVKE